MSTAWIPLDRFVEELPYEALGLEGVPKWLEALELEHLEELAADQVVVADIRAAWTDERVLYKGRFKLLADLGTLSVPLGNGAHLDLIGGAEGLTFTLEARRRSDPDATGPSVARHDLLTEDWKLVVEAPMLAIRLPNSVKPGRLQQTGDGEIAVVDPTGPTPTVFLPALRVALDSKDGVSLLPPDPASTLGLGLALSDGDLDEGIYEVQMSPPLVIFSEDLGLKVDRMVLDLSEKRSIKAVIDAGFSDAWRGFYLREARLYFTVQPTPLPLKAHIGLSDLIWGFDDEGPTGSLSFELYTFGEEQPEKLKIKPRLYYSDTIDRRPEHGIGPREIHPFDGVYSVDQLTALQLVVEVEGGKPPYAFVYDAPEAVHFDPQFGDDGTLASHSNRSPRFLFTRSVTEATVTVMVMDARGGPDDPAENQVNTVELKIVASTPPGKFSSELDALVIRVDGLSPAEAHRHAPAHPQMPHNTSVGRVHHATGVGPFTARISAMPLGDGRAHTFNAGLLKAKWFIDSTPVESMDALTFVHTFVDPGTYIVKAEVAGQGEGPVSATATIVVRAEGPLLRMERSSEVYELTNLVPVTSATHIASASDPTTTYSYLEAPMWNPGWEDSPRERLAVRLLVEVFPEFKIEVNVEVLSSILEVSSVPTDFMAKLEPVIGKLDEKVFEKVLAAVEAVWMEVLGAWAPKEPIAFTRDPSTRAFLKWFESHPIHKKKIPPNTPVERLFRELGADEVGFELTGPAPGVVWRVYRQILGWDELGSFQVPADPDALDGWTLAWTSHSGATRVRIPFLGLWSVARVQARWGSGDQAQTREMYVFQGDELGLPLGGVLATPKLPALPFHWFKRAKLEVDLYRGELTKFLVSVKLNLRALLEMGKNPDDPEDGLVDVAFTLGRDPFTKRWQWQVSVISDPLDDDGLFALDGLEAQVVGPLFLLPPILASTEGDVEAALAIIAVVAAGLAQLAPGDDPISFQRVVFQGFRLAGQGDTEFRMLTLGVDYRIDVGLDIDIDGLGALQTKEHPIGLTFANVGLGWNFDEDEPWFGWDADSGFSLDLRDEGILKFDGWLSDLVSVGRLTLGVGSPLWLKADLNGAIPGGIFRFEQFGFALSFDPGQPDDPFQVSLSAPPAVSANIPGVLKGRGTFKKEDQDGGSELVIGLQAEIVPLKVTLAGGLRIMEKTGAPLGFFLGLMAMFEPGIELFGSGVSLKGLAALVAMHYRRTVAPGGDDDPRAPYRWFVELPPKTNATDVAKWDRFAVDHWAFGGGVALGTSFDGGFSLNVFGMLIVEVPGPVIILATKVNLFKPANSEVEGSNAEEGALTAVLILDLERDTFYIGIEANYEIDNVLEVHIPAEVFFDLSDIRNFYIHIGQDDPTKRVRVKVLGIIEAWAYFMLRGQGFDGLAGRDVVIPGPGVAFGAGIDWNFGSKSANLYLHLWAELHLAIGADPWTLFGAFSAGGELGLLIITIGISADFDLLATEEEMYLEGQVCGKIRLLFWEIKACFGVDIGNEQALPPPSPAMVGLGFAPRVNAQNAEGTPDFGEGVPVGPGPTVPVDVIPRLLLRWPIDIDAVDSPLVLAGVGTERTVHVAEEATWRFRLQSVILERKSDNDWVAEVVPTAWRGKTALALGTWSPLEDALGGRMSAAATARIEEAFAKICDPVVPPSPRCYTADGVAVGPVTTQTRLVAGSEGPSVGKAWMRPGSGTAMPPTVGSSMAPLTVVDFVAASFDGAAAVSQSVRLASNGREDRYSLRIDLTPHVRVGVTFAHPRSVPATPQGSHLTVVERGRPSIPPKQVRFFHRGNLVFTLDVADGEELEVVTVHDAVLEITRCTAPPAQRVDAIELSIPRDVRQFDSGAYLLEICGVPIEAQEEESALQTHRERTLEWVSDWLGTDQADPPRLRPDTEYRLRAVTHGNWDQPQHTLPQPVVHELVSHFQTTLGPLLGERALVPYVRTTFPVDGGVGHYRDAPLAVVFEHPAVQAWYRDAGHTLLLRVKGDDGHAPLAEMVSQLLSGQPAAYTELEEVMAELLALMDCLQEHALPPGLMLATAKVVLRPGVRYTADLVALPTAQIPNDPAELPALLKPLPSLLRFAFQASRHLSLQDHLTAHHRWLHIPEEGPGQRVDVPLADTDVLAVADWILPVEVDGEPPDHGDARALDAFLSETLGLPALAAPAGPICTRLWRGAAGAWEVAGWLFDSPDPLVVDGATLTVDGVEPTQSRTPLGVRTLVWAPHAPSSEPVLALEVPTAPGLEPMTASLSLPAPIQPHAEED